MPTIGITGAKGMLGSDIAKLANSEGLSVNLYDLPEFDITRPSDIEKAVSECDCIINCAAYTNVDGAESEPEIAEAVNAVAVANLAKTVKSEDKYVLHISTDFVFGDDGINPLKETSRPNPLNVYGASKLKGEKFLEESGCRYGIIRVEWTYGKGGQNFINKIIQIAESLDEIKVVDDQVGSPTATSDAAKAILIFIKNKTEGLYHFASDGYASRFEVAKFILEEKRIKTPISPCSSKEFQAPAQRPANSRFDCSKIDKILDFERPHWKETLTSFLHGSS